MSACAATRTLVCKLAVDATVDHALSCTAHAFNAAASWCAQVAWDERIRNRTTLHHRVYGATRATFGLGAQLACCARDKALEAVKAARETGNTTCPTFRPESSIRYDANTFTLKAATCVTLNTLGRRVEAQLLLGAFQREALADPAWAVGGADLLKRDGHWYLCLTQSMPAPPTEEAVGWIGVDLGIVNLATTDDGTTFVGQHVQTVRMRRFAHRQRLQAKNTRRARWRLRKLAGKEARFQKDVNHCVSKKLVATASRACKALKLEDLTGIRPRLERTVPHAQRRERASWAFRQLRTFISYKAQWVGVAVAYVNPRNTSRTCSACSYCDPRNRRDQAHFRCLQCGFAAPADHNAAINIARAACQSASCAAPSTDGGASTSPGASALGN